LNCEEDRGFAKYKDEDPYVIRLICTKYNDDYVDSIKKVLFNIITPYHTYLQKHAISVFRKLVKHLDDYGISYWICYGSLLGYLRYQDMIPWDNDIDICINIKDLQQLHDSVKGKSDYRVIKKDGTLYRFSADGILIDIFVIDFSLNREREMYFDEVYPLKKGTYGGIECCIPNKHTNFFKRRYGLYDHLSVCLVWTHQLNDYWSDSFQNNKYLITKGDCDAIVASIKSTITMNTAKHISNINSFCSGNLRNDGNYRDDYDMVLSCVFDSSLEMFLSQLNNILIFCKFAYVVYAVKESLLEEIKRSAVNLPYNVLVNDDLIDESLFYIQNKDSKQLRYHISNYKYAKANVKFDYIGFITHSIYFIKPIEIMTSFTYFKINLEEKRWHHEQIAKDANLLSYNRELYGGQFPGTIVPRTAFESFVNDVNFDSNAYEYPYHEVYLPTLIYDHIKSTPNRHAFCKICWNNKNETIELIDIIPLCSKELYSAIYISNNIPYNDERRVYIESLTESYDIPLEIMTYAYVIKADNSSKQGSCLLGK
jgi:hypothetical protein